MTINLLDSDGKITTFDIGDFDTIGAMRIQVITDDEILIVIRKDYNIDEFDSGKDRCDDYFDDEYEIYNSVTGVNLLEDKYFMERTDSSWRWR